MREIAESDWKIIRKIHAAALERFCERALNDIDSVRNDPERSFHQRFLGLYRAMQRCNKEISDVFDNPRRSMAFQQLFAVTEAEFAQLSQGTRDVITAFENF
jgi:hypothetical protein